MPIHVYTCPNMPICSYRHIYIYIYIGVSTAIYLCCTCYIAITAQPRLCKDKLSQQKHADGNTHKVLGSIMHSYVEAVQPVYTLYSNHCVSTVAYANRAFRSLAVQVLGSFWESLGIHFGAPFCDFSVIWDARMGDWFQVHVFGDPGMEMLPDCRGCMCYNQKRMFLNGFTFSTFSLTWCTRD